MDLPSKEELDALREKNPDLYGAIIKKIQEKVASRQKLAFLDRLSYNQRRFVVTKGKRRVAVCSRRAGKSYGIAAWLLEGGLRNPHDLSIYIAVSKAMARKIMIPAFEQISREFGVPITVKEIDGQLHVLLENGHKIWLAGCRDRGEVDKFRGIYAYRVCIDEAQSCGLWLEELINDVLEPALLDRNGEMALTGTPGPVATGYFYTASTGDGGAQWPVYHWTCRNNPYIQQKPEEVTDEMLRDPSYVNPKVDLWLDEKKASNNWADDNQTYRREWLGEWVTDRGALVYPYDASKNTYWQLPEGNWRYVIGIDVGVVDDTAWTVAAYQPNLPTIYIVESRKAKRQIASTVAIKTQALMKKYNTSSVVIDAGGLGKGYQEEMLMKYGLWAEPAQKSKKRGYQAIVASEMHSGNIKIQAQKNDPLIDEMMALVWEDEQRLKESQELPNHNCDSFLYTIRHVMTSYKPDVITDPPTKAELADAQVKRNRDRLRRALAGKRKGKNKKRAWADEIRAWKG